MAFCPTTTELNSCRQRGMCAPTRVYLCICEHLLSVGGKTVGKAVAFATTATLPPCGRHGVSPKFIVFSRLASSFHPGDIFCTRRGGKKKKKKRPAAGSFHRRLDSSIHLSSLVSPPSRLNWRDVHLALIEL